MYHIMKDSNPVLKCVFIKVALQLCIKMTLQQFYQVVSLE